jgi:hypothetical protein
MLFSEVLLICRLTFNGCQKPRPDVTFVGSLFDFIEHLGVSMRDKSGPRMRLQLRDALSKVVKSYPTLGVEQSTWALLSVAAEGISLIPREEERNDLIGKCGLLLVNASLHLSDDDSFGNSEE